MDRFRQYYRLNRVALLALALLVSNIATMSCAMAYSLCGDCPEHEPVLCVDSCATAETAINDQSSDIKADSFRPVLLAVNVLPVGTQFDAPHFQVINPVPPDPHTSPPLHLQLCIFLK